jgi:GNAT superfamily N-acetyltransferase
MSDAFRIRAASQADGSFLCDMVVEAANWRASGFRPRHDVLASEEHRRYVTGWMRSSDSGTVAIDELGQPIGASWYRLLPRSEPGFGYVGTSVPELIIGVRPIWRAHGVGRALLHALVDRAREQGYARLSLSVERDNFARTLYRSEGFAVTQRGLLRDTMVRRVS